MQIPTKQIIPAQDTRLTKLTFSSLLINQKDIVKPQSQKPSPQGTELSPSFNLLPPTQPQLIRCVESTIHYCKSPILFMASKKQKYSPVKDHQMISMAEYKRHFELKRGNGLRKTEFGSTCQPQPNLYPRLAKCFNNEPTQGFVEGRSVKSQLMMKVVFPPLEVVFSTELILDLNRILCPVDKLQHFHESFPQGREFLPHPEEESRLKFSLEMNHLRLHLTQSPMRDELYLWEKANMLHSLKSTTCRCKQKETPMLCLELAGLCIDDAQTLNFLALDFYYGTCMPTPSLTRFLSLCQLPVNEKSNQCSLSWEHEIQLGAKEKHKEFQSNLGYGDDILQSENLDKRNQKDESKIFVLGEQEQKHSASNEFELKLTHILNDLKEQHDQKLDASKINLLLNLQIPFAEIRTNPTQLKQLNSFLQIFLLQIDFLTTLKKSQSDKTNYLTKERPRDNKFIEWLLRVKNQLGITVNVQEIRLDITGSNGNLEQQQKQQPTPPPQTILSTSVFDFNLFTRVTLSEKVQANMKRNEMVSNLQMVLRSLVVIRPGQQMQLKHNPFFGYHQQTKPHSPTLLNIPSTNLASYKEQDILFYSDNLRDSKLTTKPVLQVEFEILKKEISDVNRLEKKQLPQAQVIKNLRKLKLRNCHLRLGDKEFGFLDALTTDTTPESTRDELRHLARRSSAIEIKKSFIVDQVKLGQVSLSVPHMYGIDNVPSKILQRMGNQFVPQDLHLEKASQSQARFQSHVWMVFTLGQLSVSHYDLETQKSSTQGSLLTVWDVGASFLNDDSVYKEFKHIDQQLQEYRYPNLLFNQKGLPNFCKNFQGSYLDLLGFTKIMNISQAQVQISKIDKHRNDVSVSVNSIDLDINVGQIDDLSFYFQQLPTTNKKLKKAPSLPPPQQQANPEMRKLQELIIHECEQQVEEIDDFIVFKSRKTLWKDLRNEFADIVESVPANTLTLHKFDLALHQINLNLRTAEVKFVQNQEPGMNQHPSSFDAQQSEYKQMNIDDVMDANYFERLNILEEAKENQQQSHDGRIRIKEYEKTKDNLNLELRVINTKMTANRLVSAQDPNSRILNVMTRIDELSLKSCTQQKANYLTIFSQDSQSAFLEIQFHFIQQSPQKYQNLFFKYNKCFQKKQKKKRISSFLSVNQQKLNLLVTNSVIEVSKKLTKILENKSEKKLIQENSNYKLLD